LKYSIVIILFTALLAQTFSRSIALADYLVNLEAYKKACVNKTKPMMHCNGKCQMLKKMKKQEGENSKNSAALKFDQSKSVLSSKSFFPSINIISIDNIYTYHAYNNVLSSIYVGSIFHPPGVY
jgi:hypothetical protein